MRLSRLLFAAAVLACGADPEEGTGGSSEGTSSTTGTSNATTSSSGADTSSEDGSSSTTDPDTSTGVPSECEFKPTVDEVLDPSDPDPIDCGAVTLADNAAAWKAARDCARDATIDQLPYKVLFQYPDVGITRDGAFAAGNAKGHTIYRFDDDAAEGTTSVTLSVCSGISTPTSCQPSPGDICIECIDPSEPVELCD